MRPCETCGKPSIIRLNNEDMCAKCHSDYWASQGIGPYNCPVCDEPLYEHVDGKACLPPLPATQVRGLYDLPIFGWAWTGDAKQVER